MLCLYSTWLIPATHESRTRGHEKYQPRRPTVSRSTQKGISRGSGRRRPIRCQQLHAAVRLLTHRRGPRRGSAASEEEEEEEGGEEEEEESEFEEESEEEEESEDDDSGSDAPKRKKKAGGGGGGGGGGAKPKKVDERAALAALLPPPGESLLKDFEEGHTDTTVKFVLNAALPAATKLLATCTTPDAAGSGGYAASSLLKRALRLESSINTSNMHLFDANNTIRRYAHTAEIIEGACARPPPHAPALPPSPPSRARPFFPCPFPPPPPQPTNTPPRRVLHAAH